MWYDRETVDSVRKCHYGAKDGCPICCEALVTEAHFQTRTATWNASDVIQLLTLLEITYRDTGLVAAYRRLQAQNIL